MSGTVGDLIEAMGEQQAYGHILAQSIELRAAWFAVRDEVMAQARDAHAEFEHAKQVFAQPYSPLRESERDMNQAHGRWLGLWKAVEVLDALAPRSVCVTEDEGDA